LTGLPAAHPWFVLELTPACNLDCIYCCNPWTVDGRLPRVMDRGRLENLLGRIASETKPSGITFSGGEPLLTHDLPALAAFASKLFPSVSVATNGILLTRDLARKLAGAGVTSFQVSIPASREETFEAQCGSRLLRSALAGLSAAAASGASVSAAFTLTSANARECPDALRLAFAFGASSFQINRLAFGGRASAAWDSLAPGAGQVADSVAGAVLRSREYGIPCYTGIPLEVCSWPDVLLEEGCNSGCLCARLKWAVDPAGMLRPCEQSPVILGDLSTGSFIDLASSRPAEEFRAWAPVEACTGCNREPGCHGGCRYAAPPASLGRPGGCRAGSS
jgi:radical SAM protein with 4Fe4S-binding SPASM domain